MYTVLEDRAYQTVTSVSSNELRFGFWDHLLAEAMIYMVTHDMFLLRYIGVIPQMEYVEYGFRIEDKDKDPRLVVLTIESGFFKRYDLMFQEAPDLCYQKLLGEIRNETAELPVSPRFSVTASDIAHYRESHPTAKSRRSGRPAR